MGYVEIAQIIFIVSVFTIGLVGFVRAVLSDDEK